MGPWIDHFFSGGREIKRIRPPHLPPSLSLVLRSTERDESRFFPPLEEKENFRYFFKERERERGRKWKKSHHDKSEYRSLINNSEQLI